MKNAFAFTIIFALNLFTFSVLSQESFFKGILEKDQMFIGEQCRLKLQLQCLPSDSVLWPSFSDTLNAKIEIVNKSLVDTSFSDDLKTVIYTQKLSLTSFDTGFIPINPIQVLVNGNPMLTHAFLIEIPSIEVDTSKGIADIKTPIEVNFSIVDWLKVYGHWYFITQVAGIAAAMLWLAWLYFKPKKIVPPLIAKATPLPAHEIAITALQQLKGKNLWQSGKIKTYYSELTEIIRVFLNGRFSIHAMEETSSEIMLQLSHLNIEIESKERLIEVLKMADLVKFAKMNPPNALHEQSWDKCMAFVQNNKLVPTPLNPSGEKQLNPHNAI